METHSTLTAIKQIRRIGIIISGLDNANLPALCYLLLHLNTLQSTFEYEIWPLELEVENDELINILTAKQPIERELVRAKVNPFVDSYEACLRDWMAQVKITDATFPEHYILITMAQFSDGYYSMRQDRLSILALGNWKRTMAPPSILEFILTLVIRESVSTASPSLRGSVHYGTKGCLFDFTPYLEDARYKVLNAFICTYCRNALEKDQLLGLADEIIIVLRKHWFGKAADLDSPAGITAKLGYNLFLTKGLQTNFWEKLIDILREESVRLVMSVIGTVLVAGLLLWLGLSKP